MTSTIALKDTTNLIDYREAGGNPDSAANQSILRKLVDREVMHCISSTVSHFAQNMDACCDGVDYDDILDLCTGKDWEEPGQDRVRDMDRSELISSLADGGVDLPGYGEEDEDEGIDSGGSLTDEELRAMLLDDIDDWQEFCEGERIEPYDVEAYEHWAVTSWFKARLAEHGEIVGDLLDFDVWGRCCTGQAISMDHVIASIAAEMGIMEGQKNDWSE